MMREFVELTIRIPKKIAQDFQETITQIPGVVILESRTLLTCEVLRSWKEEIARLETLVSTTQEAVMKDSQVLENFGLLLEQLSKIQLFKNIKIRYGENLDRFAQDVIEIFQRSVDEYKQFEERPARNIVRGDTKWITYTKPKVDILTPRQIRLIIHSCGLSGPKIDQKALEELEGIRTVPESLSSALLDLTKIFRYAPPRQLHKS